MKYELNDIRCVLLRLARALEENDVIKLSNVQEDLGTYSMSAEAYEAIVYLIGRCDELITEDSMDKVVKLNEPKPVDVFKGSLSEPPVWRGTYTDGKD